MIPDFVRNLARLPRHLVFTAALVLAGPSLLGGQVETGALAGVVRDTTGSPIAHAGVRLLATPYMVSTDTAGRYAFEKVPVGTYTMRINYVGYRPKEVTGVEIVAGQRRRLDVSLEATAVEIQELTVVGATNALMPRDQVTSKQLVQGGYTDRMPVDRLRSVRAGQPGVAVVSPPPTGESYARIHDNPFLGARDNPLSTFGVDVDRASYSNIRRFIDAGKAPPPDAVRIEEMLNYFGYSYPEPAARSEHPFTVTTELSVAPWRPEHRLLRIGLQARRIDVADLPPANLVFLIDVSGSMRPANKLPLVKRALGMLVAELRDIDRVALVVYAGQAGVVLESTPGTAKAAILAAIDRLEAGGSTAGGAGIRLAYDIARQHLITGGNNRVILATDGDFNVGASSDADMERLIEVERTHGVFFTVLGFGMGNYQDAKLETLADKGNGNYAYIDDALEAEKTLVHELGGTLFTVAKDVKIQVEFNPAQVASYRLIGYENRLLAREDFDDDTKDAGEMGAGHSVTALYEIVPVGADEPLAGVPADSLRYQHTADLASGPRGDELVFVQLRYKTPDGTTSKLLAHVVPNRVQEPSTDMRFASAVASFGMILRASEQRGEMGLDDVAALAERSLGADAEGYRAGFVDLVHRYRGLTLAADD